jgi:hypothetical protein
MYVRIYVCMYGGMYIRMDGFYMRFGSIIKDNVYMLTLLT